MFKFDLFVMFKFVFEFYFDVSDFVKFIILLIIIYMKIIFECRDDELYFYF